MLNNLMIWRWVGKWLCKAKWCNSTWSVTLLLYSNYFPKIRWLAQTSFCITEMCCVQTNKLNGILGRPVTMQCPYPPQHRDNRKFLCMGDHRCNCTNVVKSESRFTLQDDVSSSSFLVMITELKAEDAATYWCGSDSQWSAGNYISSVHFKFKVFFSYFCWCGNK